MEVEYVLTLMIQSLIDDDEETDVEMDTDDNEDKPHDILLKIGFAFGNLKYSRKQYRDALPQLGEHF